MVDRHAMRHARVAPRILSRHLPLRYDAGAMLEEAAAADGKMPAEIIRHKKGRCHRCRSRPRPRPRPPRPPSSSFADARLCYHANGACLPLPNIMRAKDIDTGAATDTAH